MEQRFPMGEFPGFLLRQHRTGIRANSNPNSAIDTHADGNINATADVNTDIHSKSDTHSDSYPHPHSNTPTHRERLFRVAG
jgi:hypothetical protein